MYVGSVGYIISLSLIAASFIFQWGGMVLPLFLFLFIAAHAIGQGAVIWVFISEIFPTTCAVQGKLLAPQHMGIGRDYPLVGAGSFGWIGPGAVFGVFAFMMVLQLAFVYFYMPETKGVTLEKLSDQLLRE